MFENLKDKSLTLPEGQHVIEEFSAEEIDRLKQSFLYEGTGIVEHFTEAPVPSLRRFQRLELRSVRSLVWLTVMDGDRAMMFCANECEDFFL